MGSWSRVGRSLVVGALVAAVSFSSISAPPVANAKAPAGIAAPFAETWQSIGGSNLGAPVTPALEIDGRLTQFFAYGALIEAGTESGVAERYAVGSALAEATHAPDRLVQGRRGGSSRSTESFAAQPGNPYQTSLAIAEGFERLGGAERFGEPISWPATVAGQQVQWFQYGRITWGPREKGGSPALVGWELARELGLPVAREVASVDAAPVEDVESPPVSPGGFAPARIEIPSIGVNASIEQIGIVNGVMQTPANAWSVGWYQETSLAGGNGNAVFAAHRDWWSVGPVVFYRLGEVGIGETITLTGAEGETATYLVTDVYSVPASADFSPLISANGMDEITLITCSGTWDGAGYVDRLIVRGVLV